MRLIQRLAAVALTFVVAAGTPAVCAGWSPAPETRMACCAEDAGCAMHPSDTHDVTARTVPTQADADACCASSESQQSRQSHIPTIAVITPAVLGAAVILPADGPEVVLHGRWRPAAPTLLAPVHRHVLFSVFLI